MDEAPARAARIDAPLLNARLSKAQGADELQCFGEALWGGLPAQRMGRSIPESQRSSSATLKLLNDGLADPLGSRLAAVVDLLNQGQERGGGQRGCEGGGDWGGGGEEEGRQGDTAAHDRQRAPDLRHAGGRLVV